MFIWYLFLITAGAQDYASEVLYPDDLIPVEDLEGKFVFYIFLFEIWIKINLSSHRCQRRQQQQQQPPMMTKEVNQVTRDFLY